MPSRGNSVDKERIALSEEEPPEEVLTRLTWKGIFKLSLENPTKWTTVKDASFGSYKNLRSVAKHLDNEVPNNGFDLRWQETQAGEGNANRGIVWIKPL
jgi:hypothetical protein